MKRTKLVLSLVLVLFSFSNAVMAGGAPPNYAGLRSYHKSIMEMADIGAPADETNRCGYFVQLQADISQWLWAHSYVRSKLEGQRNRLLMIVAVKESRQLDLTNAEAQLSNLAKIEQLKQKITKIETRLANLQSWHMLVGDKRHYAHNGSFSWCVMYMGDMLETCQPEILEPESALHVLKNPSPEYLTYGNARNLFNFHISNHATDEMGDGEEGKLEHLTMAVTLSDPDTYNMLSNCHLENTWGNPLTIMTSPAVYLNGEYGVMSFTFSDGSIEIEANSSENFRLICDFLPKEEDAPENLVIAIGFLEERDLSPKEAIKAIGTTTGTDLNVSPQFSVSNTLILL